MTIKYKTQITRNTCVRRHLSTFKWYIVYNLTICRNEVPMAKLADKQVTSKASFRNCLCCHHPHFWAWGCSGLHEKNSWQFNLNIMVKAKSKLLFLSHYKMKQYFRLENNLILNENLCLWYTLQSDDSFLVLSWKKTEDSEYLWIPVILN